MTDVTVVIPTRDRAELVGRAIRSALSQRDVSVEVVCVDDGSGDDTRAFLASLSDERIRVSRLERPCGMAAARNRGAALASSSWIAFLDDDDLWAPEKLRCQLTAAGSGQSFVYSGAYAVTDQGRIIRELPAPNPHGVASDLLRRNVIPAGASNALVSTELLRSIGGFDESFMHLADWDLWIRLCHHSPPAALPDTHVAYVQHAGNAFLLRAGELLKEFDRLAAKHGPLAQAAGVSFDHVDFRRFVANAHRRAGRSFTAARTYLGPDPVLMNVISAGRAVRSAIEIRQRMSKRQPAPAWVTRQLATPWSYEPAPAPDTR